MKKIIAITILFLGVRCTQNGTNNEVEKRSINEVETELLKLISEFQNSFVDGGELNEEKYKKYLSPSLKNEFVKEMKIENVDSALHTLFTATHTMMEDLRSRGAHISNKVIGIKEQLINGDTLVYLVQNDMILTIKDKNKKIVDTDYILAISNNYGNDWFFYQPHLANLKDLISNQIDLESYEEIQTFVKKYKAKESITNLN